MAENENQTPPGQQPQTGSLPLRTDGPTLEEYIKQGYKAENYPPPGYATVTSKPPEPTPLETALTKAKDALGAAVRSARLNNIGDTESLNVLETEFENAKNAADKPAKGHLQNAVKALEIATNLLANHSLKDANDLKTVKNGYRAAQVALANLK